MLKDLTDTATQRCSLKNVFFKESSILKTTCMYVNFFKKVVNRKPAAYLKIAQSDIFFKDFALHVLRISEYFKDTSMEHLSVNALLVEATLRSH